MSAVADRRFSRSFRTDSTARGPCRNPRGWSILKGSGLTIIVQAKGLDNGERHSIRWNLFLFQEMGVIKHDIVNEVVDRTGITKTKAEIAVETVFESMKKALAQGDRIELRGFGVFNVRPRKTGIGRNPRTGAEVNIQPGKAVRFKPGKELQSLP